MKVLGFARGAVWMALLGVAMMGCQPQGGGSGAPATPPAEKKSTEGGSGEQATEGQGSHSATTEEGAGGR